MRLAALLLVSGLEMASPVLNAEPAAKIEYKLIDPDDASSLSLVADGTCVYARRGSSCWTWGEYSGHWQRRGDLLELVYEVQYTEWRTTIVDQRQKDDPEKLRAYVVELTAGRSKTSKSHSVIRLHAGIRVTTGSQSWRSSICCQPRREAANARRRLT